MRMDALLCHLSSSELGDHGFYDQRIILDQNSWITWFVGKRRLSTMEFGEPGSRLGRQKTEGIDRHNRGGSSATFGTDGSMT